MKTIKHIAFLILVFLCESTSLAQSEFRQGCGEAGSCLAYTMIRISKVPSQWCESIGLAEGCTEDTALERCMSLSEEDHRHSIRHMYPDSRVICTAVGAIDIIKRKKLDTLRGSELWLAMSGLAHVNFTFGEFDTRYRCDSSGYIDLILNIYTDSKYSEYYSTCPTTANQISHSWQRLSRGPFAPETTRRNSIDLLIDIISNVNQPP